METTKDPRWNADAPDKLGCPELWKLAGCGAARTVRFRIDEGHRPQGRRPRTKEPVAPAPSAEPAATSSASSGAKSGLATCLGGQPRGVREGVAPAPALVPLAPLAEATPASTASTASAL